MAVGVASGKRWSRAELLIVLNLYHKLNFGQMDHRNPAVMALAGKLERTPGSVAMKLGNLASLDPALQLRGIKGLQGASALDRTVWQEFNTSPADVIPETEEALAVLFNARSTEEIEVLPREGIRVGKTPPSGPTIVIANTKLRRGQSYFRNVVINNFGGRCGITELPIRELLVASHILPWGGHESERLNVRNGLALSRLHDAAFDCGLITFDEDLRLVLSLRLKRELPQRSVSESFGAYAGERLKYPDDAVLPDMSFLAEHRAVTFRRR
ncbi:HNH endonuclease [Luteolibacter sp. SL250]|uniref:HNH endonuclease n=1 Tax=Luteolibacter sp. SL250 TaxID=2995170 RepID=UPI00226E2F2D|nr:HNH endonuclease [Luteolibacter sp. SL250]WAC20401.1 HNH endonuclease [Luteolibacter sp. SL250]